MKSEKIVFLIVAVVFLAATLGFALAKDSTVGATLFVVELLIVLAFFLFRHGNLGVFRIEALSAKAEFIRATASEAETLLSDIREVRDRVLVLDKEVAKTAELAAPPTLALDHIEARDDDKGLSIVIRLKRSKPQPMGPIVVAVAIPDDSPAKIISFKPSKCVGAFIGGEDDNHKNNPKISVFQFHPLAGVVPLALDLTLSGPTQLRIEANHGFQAVNIEVA